MTHDLYFHDLPLPKLRTFFVWGVRLHPDGRQELRQCRARDLVYVSDAVKMLR